MRNIYYKVQFQPNCAVVWKDLSDFRTTRSQTNEDSLANLEKGARGMYNGYMSKATSTKCKKMINGLLLAIEFGKIKRTPTFVTLTLPSTQNHPDKFIRRHLLGRFIKAMKRKHDVKYYFHRSEPQANGNIHFHLLMDSFIKWEDVRGNWNFILEKYGYIDDYRAAQEEWHKNGFKLRPELVKRRKDKRTGKMVGGWTEEKQRKAYDYGVQTNWGNPNSSDIHALKKIKNVSAYLCKYLTKTEQDKNKPQVRAIEGRIWGASDELRELDYFNGMAFGQTVDGEIIEYDELIDDYMQKLSEIEGVKIKETSDNMIQVFLLDKRQHQLMSKHAPMLYRYYYHHYSEAAKKLYS